jgi:hypothetical protein
MHYYQKIENDLRYKFEINLGWKHIGILHSKWNDAPGCATGTISICGIEY